MAGAKEFSAVNAKVSGMKKHLLSTKEYEYILGASQREILEFLKHKEFIKATDFQELDYLSVHLKRILIEKMEALSSFTANKYKELMDLIIDRYEIDDVKKALRNIYNNNQVEKESFVIREDFASEVNSKMDMMNFIETLKDERYYGYLRNYKDMQDEEILFYLEMSLDRFHYSHIYNFCEKLDRSSRKKAKELFGTIIDLKNIIWIYRAKKFYHVDDTLIYNYSIFRGSKYGPEDLLRLSKLDLESFLKEMYDSSYSFLFTNEEDENNVDMYMSLSMDRYLYNSFSDYLKNMSFDMGKILGYILIYEFQIKDIMVIMQGKELNLDKNEFKKYLIGYQERR